VAILDWELSTIGHPLADVSYSCMLYHLTLPDALPEGFLSEAEFLDRYCQQTGRERIENWSFYLVFSLFRYASIALGVYKRGLDGNASSEHWKNFDAAAHRTADIAWRLANGDA